jgi:hypothetical protein
MQNLLAVVLVAVLCLAIRLLSSPPSWVGSLADRVPRARVPDDGEPPESGADVPGGADQVTVEEVLLTQPFVRRRLDALAEELERLDRDPDVFAKAFHTMVARSARDALRADASRLADRPPRCTRDTFDVEVVGPSTGPREELEL